MIIAVLATVQVSSSGRLFCHFKFAVANLALCKIFRSLNCLATSFVHEEMPCSATTGTRKQAELPVRQAESDKSQHGLRVGAGKPLLLVHGVSKGFSVQRAAPRF